MVGIGVGCWEKQASLPAAVVYMLPGHFAQVSAEPLIVAPYPTLHKHGESAVGHVTIAVPGSVVCDNGIDVHEEGMVTDERA